MKSMVWRVVALVTIVFIGVVAIYMVASNKGSKAVPPSVTNDDSTLATNVAQGKDSEGKPVATGPQPKIQFKETVYNWGTVYQEAKVTHIFTFKNVGQAELNISNVKSG